MTTIGAAQRAAAVTRAIRGRYGNPRLRVRTGINTVGDVHLRVSTGAARDHSVADRLLTRVVSTALGIQLELVSYQRPYRPGFYDWTHLTFGPAAVSESPDGAHPLEGNDGGEQA